MSYPAQAEGLVNMIMVSKEVDNEIQLSFFYEEQKEMYLLLHLINGLRCMFLRHLVYR